MASSCSQLLRTIITDYVAAYQNWSNTFSVTAVPHTRMGIRHFFASALEWVKRPPASGFCSLKLSARGLSEVSGFEIAAEFVSFLGGSDNLRYDSNCGSCI